MNRNSFNQVRFDLPGIGFWIAVLLGIWLLGSVGLGWLVDSLFILLLFILVTPVIAFIGLRWWLQRNLIQDQCPVCHYEFTGLNRTQFACPSCGEPLEIHNKRFSRVSPPNTVDVEVIEVPVQQIED